MSSRRKWILAGFAPARSALRFLRLSPGAGGLVLRRRRAFGGFFGRGCRIGRLLPQPARRRCRPLGQLIVRPRRSLGLLRGASSLGLFAALASGGRRVGRKHFTHVVPGPPPRFQRPLLPPIPCSR